MKVLICGGNGYKYDYDDLDAMDRAKSEMPISWMLVPLMRGAGLGYHWATRRKVPMTMFKPEDGIPKETEGVIILPGNNSFIASVREYAFEHNLEVYDWSNVRKSNPL